MSHLDRRTFLTATLATAALATAAGGFLLSGRSASEDYLGPTFLALAFPDGYRSPASLVAAIEQRIAFTVRDEIDYLRESAPDSLSVLIAAQGMDPIRAELPRHVDGIITPYYPLRLTFPAIGEYTVTLPEFSNVAAVTFLVTSADAVALAQVGDPFPVVDTPTFDNARGVADICTRAIDCPFHEHNLTDVVANGRPTVVLVATPGFCQTDICGPVVDLLIDAAQNIETIDFIHAEVYVDPREFETGAFPATTDIVNALALPFEPSLFVADGSGTIVRRVDMTFDRVELAEALASV